MHAAELRGRAATEPSRTARRLGRGMAEVKRAQDLLRQGDVDPSLRGALSSRGRRRSEDEPRPTAPI